MNHPSIRRASGAAWLALLGLLAACGPGVGGSGTGQTQDTLPPALGASPAQLCSSELAPVLACATGASAVAGGSAPVGFAAIVDGQSVQVRIEGNRITFSAGCTHLRFAGTWGQGPGMEARFQGLIDPSGAATPATMAAARNGNGLLLTLRDANGAPLYGPIAVSPAAGAAPCE